MRIKSRVIIYELGLPFGITTVLTECGFSPFNITGADKQT